MKTLLQLMSYHYVGGHFSAACIYLSTKNKIDINMVLIRFVLVLKYENAFDLSIKQFSNENAFIFFFSIELFSYRMIFFTNHFMIVSPHGLQQLNRMGTNLITSIR